MYSLFYPFFFLSYSISSLLSCFLFILRANFLLFLIPLRLSFSFSFSLFPILSSILFLTFSCHLLSFSLFASLISLPSSPCSFLSRISLFLFLFIPHSFLPSSSSLNVPSFYLSPSHFISFPSVCIFQILSFHSLSFHTHLSLISLSTFYFISLSPASPSSPLRIFKPSSSLRPLHPKASSLLSSA